MKASYFQNSLNGNRFCTLVFDQGIEIQTPKKVIESHKKFAKKVIHHYGVEKIILRKIKLFVMFILDSKPCLPDIKIYILFAMLPIHTHILIHLSSYVFVSVSPSLHRSIDRYLIDINLLLQIVYMEVICNLKVLKNQ